MYPVEKKGGKLRLVHDLQPLNTVTFRDAGLPIRMDDLVEAFAGHTIYCIADLKAGYDGRRLDEKSRHLTAFHAYNYGLLRLTSLPQGYTNSMQEFCRRTHRIVKLFIPEREGCFVDDITAMGLKSYYENEAIVGNSLVRKFVWEFANTLNEILARIRTAGAKVSGDKLVLATPRLNLLGTVVSKEGASVSRSTTSRVENAPASRKCEDS